MAERVGHGLKLISGQLVIIPQTTVIGGSTSALNKQQHWRPFCSQTTCVAITTYSAI